jgi:hypothetical protein
MASALNTVLNELAAALQPALPASVTIIIEDQLDAATELTKALSAASGLAVIVSLISASVEAHGSPPPASALIRIAIIEAPELNRAATGAGKSALEIAEDILNQFLSARLAISAASATINDPALQRITVSLDSLDRDLFAGYELRLELSGIPITATRSTAAITSATPGPVTDGHVTITFTWTPPGARVFYSAAADARPVPRSAALVDPSTAAITVTAGSTVRCIPALPGWWSGDIVRVTT